MKTSEIRALFSVVSRPEVVSLAGGMPAVTALPLDAVGSMIGDLVSGMGAQTLQYGSGQGDPRLRERICDVMALEGITDASPTRSSSPSAPSRASTWSPGSSAIPGDVILAEGPSYVGALGVFQAAQARVRHVAMDDDGLIPEALEEALPDCRAAGDRVKFLYTVPNFHNPAGVTLSEPRREAIIAIAERHDLLIIEDNPYGLLGFERRADARAAGPRQPAGHLPRLVLQDLLPGPAGRLGAGAARRPREAGAGHRGAGALPAVAHPVRRRPLPGHPALARADQAVHRALPRAPGRHAGVAGRAHAGRHRPGPGPTAASTSG